MFAPVGYGGASVKIAPPLVIREEPLREGIAVLEEAIEEADCMMTDVAADHQSMTKAV